MDKNPPIAEAWAMYAEHGVPSTIPSAGMTMLKHTFYAGVAIAIDMIHEASSAKCSKEETIVKLNAINADIAQFLEDETTRKE